MKKATKHSHLITLTLVFFTLMFLNNAKADSVEPSLQELSLDEIRKLRVKEPDNALVALQHLYEKSLTGKDTVMAINAMMELAWSYGHQANYKETYDKLWNALLLADAANLKMKTAGIYRAIGRYYGFYSRKENALKFLNLSLNIKKELVNQGAFDKARLAVNYHSFAATYRELGELDLCKTYLDSAYMYHSTENSIIKFSFLEFEKAVWLLNNQKYDDALVIFNNIQPWYETNVPGYQVLVFNYMGDTYKGLGQYSISEQFYRKALKTAENYHSHFDFTPLVYQRLSDLYFRQGNYVQAYESLKKFKELDGQFFDSRSENNRPLLEIQDAFRKEKEEQASFLQEQKLLQLEQEEKVLFLQRALLIGSLVFLVIIGLIYFNYVKSKHKVETQLIQKQQELEIQKNNELVELKNKELATSALKLIEKDTFIKALKDKLKEKKGDFERKEIEQIIRAATNDTNGNWKAFEAQFIAVNTSFYEKLNERFPKLSQSEQRLCALVKLNFSSKEMAQLLSMSVESVHTSRSRLRKKLNLERSTNLREFIANIQ